MGKPDAPTPPNPYQTASAATGTNVATAIANANLNNVNQVTPQGNLNYNTTGNYTFTDPVSGSTYNIPQFTATQTLTPEGQAIQAQTLAAQYNLAGMANTQSGNVANILNTPFNPNTNAPAAPGWGWIGAQPQASTSYTAGGPIQTGVSMGGAANQSNIASTYGPDDLNAYTQQVQQALMGQINPQLDIQKQQLTQQLADQGIRYGSQAYNNAMLPFEQQQNQAWMGAVTGATGQAKTLMDIAAQQAGFQNAAQQQAYQQNLGMGAFANQAQAQQNQQNAMAAQFGNAGLAQQLAQMQSAFNAAQTQRNQNLQEQYMQRNQPLNEISAMMAGSQIQAPNWLNTPTSQIPTTDIAGLINNQFNQQLGVYQQQNANYQTLMGGVLGLGAGALKSDVRSKENIVPMATVFAAGDDDEPRRLPIYQYSYKDDPDETRHVGPMAQDVERIDPDAVTEHRGVKYIYPEKVMGSILRAA